MKKYFFIILLIILSILGSVFIVLGRQNGKVVYSILKNIPENSNIIKDEDDIINVEEGKEIENVSVNKKNTNEKEGLSSSSKRKDTKEDEKSKTKTRTNSKNNYESQKDKTKKITTNVSKKENETISNDASKKKENSPSNQNDKTDITNKKANNKHTHSIIGTSGMWVTSVDEIIKEWDKLSNYYEELLSKNKITWEEYCQRCPNGYYNVMHCVTDLNCNYITWDWQYVN